MAKMKLDFSESKRVVYPEGEYSLQPTKRTTKPSKSSGKPMFEMEWRPFNPPDGVNMQDYQNAKGENPPIRSWISLAPNALFSLANLMFAAGMDKECAGCGLGYKANLEVCPSCQSALFEFDPDAIDQIQEVRAFVKVEKDQKGENDVNTIATFIAPSA